MRTKLPSPRPRRRLFWRIYLYGLVSLVLVTASAAHVFIVAGDPPPWHERLKRLAGLVARDFDSHAPGSPRLQERLDELRFVLQGDLALYRRDGSLLAAAGLAPPPPLEPDHARALVEEELSHGRGRVHAALPLVPGDSTGPYLVLGIEAPGGPRRVLLVLAAVLVVLGLISVPMARSIARPLERLTQTARELAAGDLSVRTGLSRKDEVGVLAGTMDEMAVRLEHRLRAEKELLANISHEIRTPLARIRVALELCSEAPASIDEIMSHLAGIEGDIGELEQLVDQVLSAARLDLSVDRGEDGGFLPKRAAVKLTDLVEQASARFERLHPGSRLRVDLPETLPVVEADPALVRRVLDNLLDNAGKYSEAGAEVDLAAGSGPGELWVEVRDRGIGVAEQDLARLFEPFFRSDRSRARGAGGAGLGLTLCKRIVEAHEGTISARNRPKGGMVMRFVLPLD